MAGIVGDLKTLQHDPFLRTSNTSIQKTIMLPMLALYLLAFLGTAQAAGECANVTLTFCDNVRWQVNEEKRARADNIESMIQMSYYNQPGKWSCKNEFKDLQCRVMFPQCTDVGGVGANKAPCRSKCTDFLSRCPGADIGCDDLSNDPKQCYEVSQSLISYLQTICFNRTVVLFGVAWQDGLSFWLFPEC